MRTHFIGYHHVSNFQPSFHWMSKHNLPAYHSLLPTLLYIFITFQSLPLLNLNTTNQVHDNKINQIQNLQDLPSCCPEHWLTGPSCSSSGQQGLALVRTACTWAGCRTPEEGGEEPSPSLKPWLALEWGTPATQTEGGQARPGFGQEGEDTLPSMQLSREGSKEPGPSPPCRRKICTYHQNSWHSVWWRDQWWGRWWWLRGDRSQG